jgi:hypothetical protein
METQSKLPILVAGATGALGVPLVNYAIKSGKLQVNILTRDKDKCKTIADLVEKNGGKVFVGNIMKPETLTNLMYFES